MTQATIEVAYAQGTRIKTKADVRGALAVHQGIDTVDWWAVTHVPTGYAVAMLPNEDLAEEFRRAVEGLVKWERVRLPKRMSAGWQPVGIPFETRQHIKEIRRKLNGAEP